MDSRTYKMLKNCPISTKKSLLKRLYKTAVRKDTTIRNNVESVMKKLGKDKVNDILDNSKTRSDIGELSNTFNTVGRGALGLALGVTSSNFIYQILSKPEIAVILDAIFGPIGKVLWLFGISMFIIGKIIHISDKKATVKI